MSVNESNLRKGFGSSLADYIGVLEDKYEMDPRNVGRHILNALSQRTNARQEAPSEETKRNIVQNLHENIRKVWLALRFGNYNDEMPMQTDIEAKPDYLTLEGSVERLSHARPDTFLQDMRDMTVRASDRYHAHAKIPFSDHWAIYDHMRAEISALIDYTKDKRE